MAQIVINTTCVASQTRAWSGCTAAPGKPFQNFCRN